MHLLAEGAQIFKAQKMTGQMFGLGWEDGADVQIGATIFLSLLNLLGIMGGDADNQIGGEFSRVHNGKILLSEMDTICLGGHCRIHSVIDDEQGTIFTGE